MSFINKKLILSFCLIALVFQLSFADRLLKYKRVQQKQSEWCWAGTSQWILGYHTIFLADTDSLSQVKINEYGWADGKVRNMWNYIYTQSEGGDVISGQSYKGRGINWILPHFGVPITNITNGSKYTFNEERYAKTIDAGHPFIIRWQLSAGGGHFVVAMAYINKMCWIMNPWKDDGIQIFNYAWVSKNNHHTWDYTLESNRIDTLPTLVSVFPDKVIIGKKYEIKLIAKTNADKDVSSIVYYNTITKNIVIDSITNTLSWTPDKEGEQYIEFEMNYGNARDTIRKTFNAITGTVNLNISTSHYLCVTYQKIRKAFRINFTIPKSGGTVTTVDIYTLNGKMVLNKKIVGKGTHSFQLNIFDFKQSVYVLAIKNNHQTMNKKLIL